MLIAGRVDQREYQTTNDVPKSGLCGAEPMGELPHSFARWTFDARSTGIQVSGEWSSPGQPALTGAIHACSRPLGSRRDSQRRSTAI